MIGFRLISFLCLGFSLTLLAGDLKPILAQPDEIVYESDFSQAGKLNKAEWMPRQATQWKIVDGVLRGTESTAENQAKKSHHRGLEPRVSAPITPPQFIAKFSVRFSEGEETTIVPFVEFGHHIVRLRFTAEEGLSMLADYETLKIAAAPEFKFEIGKWYHALAELKGAEFVIQFQDGPTLFGTHPCFAKPAPSGGSGFGLAGPRGGIAEIDNMTFWTIKPEAQADWDVRKAKFPKFDAIQVREHPKK